MPYRRQWTVNKWSKRWQESSGSEVPQKQREQRVSRRERSIASDSAGRDQTVSTGCREMHDDFGRELFQKSGGGPLLYFWK